MSEKKFDYKNFNVKKNLQYLVIKYKSNKAIISGLAYFVLVIVVIYGLNVGVYEGFPLLVPYVIMLLFLFMAFRRLYQWFMKQPPKNGDCKSENEKK
ncbi:MAG: hypothetical protein ACI4IJ_08595 [Acutalibacteraceae bacterium]